jgi:hypothetical protein
VINVVETIRDVDLHPDEAGVRVFTIPRSGLLRADPDALIYEVRYGDVVLRHYAFADQWFKVNVTTDLSGGCCRSCPASCRSDRRLRRPPCPNRSSRRQRSPGISSVPGALP